MPPRGAPRRSSRATSPDHLYSRSTRSTPSSTTRQTRRATRASTAADQREDGPTSVGTGTRASTPESDNEPTTPQDEPVEQDDTGSDSPSGRPSTKRTRTTKALETEETLTSRQRGYGRKREVEVDEEEKESYKRQESTTVQHVDDPDSPLTYHGEPEGPGPRKKRATGVVEAEEKVAVAAPPQAGHDQHVQPPPKRPNIASKGRKQNWRFDFQSASSSPEHPQPTPLPPVSNAAPPPPAPVVPVQPSPAAVVKKPSAKATGRGGIKGKGKKAATSLLTKPSKENWFEVILFDDPFAALEAYLRSLSSSYRSTRPSSSTPLRPLSVTRSTSSARPFVAYRFPLSTVDGRSNIERVVVKVAGRKGRVRGPTEAEQAAMLEGRREEEGEAADGRERVGRWLLLMDGEETRWLLR